MNFGSSFSADVYLTLERDATSGRDESRELLTQAIAMYRQIGMPKHVEMAEVALREL